MAQLNLQPPGQFDFKNPDDWPRWKRRFKQFRVASGLTEDSAKKQISTLLYCLGEEAEAVLASTNATADERKVHDTVVSKFDGFFGVRTSSSNERGSIDGTSKTAKVPNTISWLCTNSQLTATTETSVRR